jgi:hypothetical protein
VQPPGSDALAAAIAHHAQNTITGETRDIVNI